MKIRVTNPKNSTINLIVFETIESVGFSAYGSVHALKPGEHVYVEVNENAGYKVERLGRDDDLQPR